MKIKASVGDQSLEVAPYMVCEIGTGCPEELVYIDPTHDFGKNTFHGLELLRRSRSRADYLFDAIETPSY